MEREAMRLSQMDLRQNIPTQIWYDQLRESDDGRFSQQAAMSPVNQNEGDKKYLDLISPK
jgi:hypothetical protein